jgi:hypothetical protein
VSRPPAPPVRPRPAWALVGALVVLPLLVAGLAALVTGALDCGDDAGGWAVLLGVPALSIGAACGWTWRCGLRRWALAWTVAGASALASMAGWFAWFAVGFDKCFVF